MSKLSLGAAIWAGLSLLAPLAAPAETLFVSNEKDNTLSVVDVASLGLIATIPVGRRPRGLVASPDGKLLYLCASDSNMIQVIDAATGKALHNLPSGEDPEQFALSPDGKRLFVANEASSLTTIIDTEKRAEIAQVDVGAEPEGMAVSPDGRLVVTTSESASMAHWIDANSFQLIDSTPTPQRPRYAIFDKAGARLWVSSEVGGAVTVFDVATRALVKTIHFAIPGVPRDQIAPVGVRLTSDGRYAFVALGPASHVAVIDAKTFDVVKYVVTGRRVWQLALSGDEKLLFTTNGVSGDVTAIDVEKLAAVKSLKVGRYPWGAAVVPGAFAPAH